MWYDVISDNDSSISHIRVNGRSLIIEITRWNGELLRIVCEDYYGCKDRMSIGQDIGEVRLLDDCSFKSEIVQDYELSDAENTGLKCLVFYEAWDNRKILEVVAGSFKVE